MPNVFEIVDKTGRIIILTQEQWSHIVQHHPDMSDKGEEVQRCLQVPTAVIPHKYDDAKANYYQYQKETADYLVVIVKYINGKGYVKSAFYTQKLVRR